MVNLYTLRVASGTSMPLLWLSLISGPYLGSQLWEWKSSCSLCSFYLQFVVRWWHLHDDEVLYSQPQKKCKAALCLVVGVPVNLLTLGKTILQHLLCWMLPCVAGQVSVLHGRLYAKFCKFNLYTSGALVKASWLSGWGTGRTLDYMYNEMMWYAWVWKNGKG